MVCKACFRPFLDVFHPIWVLGQGGGVSQGIGTQPAYAVFHRGQLVVILTRCKIIILSNKPIPQ